jgi:DNA invertase Pin-like site-specific DNA recombinase
MALRPAVGYVRVSTAEQVEGFGLEVQERSIRDFAKGKGLRLLEIERDEGQSGSNGLDSRSGLAGALAKLETGRASTLVVYRLDRLARDLLLQETLIARLRQAGAEVVSVTEPDVDGGGQDPTRDLVRQVLGAIAQYERAVIKGRLMAGKAAKVAQGGYGGGRPPYGLRASNRRLVKNPDEAPVVEMIARLRSEGCSYRKIADSLAAAGMRPRQGNRWHAMTVQRIAGRHGKL